MSEYVRPKRFVPLVHRPVLPLHGSKAGRRGMDQFHYLHVAWHVYWNMVRDLQEQEELDTLWEAHQKVQAAHPFEVPEELSEAYTTPDDHLLLFLWQFEEWQSRAWDLDELYDDDNHEFRVIQHRAVELINAQTTVEKAFELHPDDLRSDFVDQLWCRGHKHILEQIVDDPIFGEQAQQELFNMKRSEEFAISEVFRRSSLPEPVRQIDELISKAGPTNYSVHFPYPPNPYHNVPNCLCVLGDGGPIFRLEVLDPDTVSRFRLAEVMNPWWKDSGLLEQCGPGEGEYDFPFYDFNIHEDDEFDHDKLMQVLERGVEQINTRSQRKWGT